MKRSGRGILRAWAPILTLLFTCAPGGHAGQGPAEKVVFLSNRAGIPRTFDLLAASAGDSGTLTVTLPKFDAEVTSLSAPRWVWTDSLLAFLGAGGTRLCVLDLRTSRIRDVAEVHYEATEFSVSPDRRSLLFVDRVGKLLQVMEADIATGTVRNLTANRWNNTEPSFSAGGDRIAYVTDMDGSASIAVMRRDGTGQRVLTNNFGDDHSPGFSPDGARIVFSSSRSAANDHENDLYLIDTNGTGFRPLFQNGASNERPVFTPDGKSIVFVSTVLASKTSRVLLMNLATGTLTVVSAGLPLLCRNFSISRSGRFVAFEHNTIADCEIMVYDVIARTLRNLSGHPAWDCSPSF